MSINLLNEGDLNKYLTSVVYIEGEVPHWVSENSSESQKINPPIKGGFFITEFKEIYKEGKNLIP